MPAFCLQIDSLMITEPCVNFLLSVLKTDVTAPQEAEPERTHDCRRVPLKWPMGLHR